MLFTSAMIKSFYKIKDNEDAYITLKHRLKNYYKFAFNLALISIVAVFALDIFKLGYIETPWLSMNLVWVSRSSIFCIIASNIFANYKTTNLLYKVFVQNND